LLRRYYQALSGERIDDDTTYPSEQHSDLVIAENKIFLQRTARIYYTAYDLRRDYDSITSTHPDVMLLSNDDSENGNLSVYWYGRVQMIFHLNVLPNRSSARDRGQPRRMDVMLVRWFGDDPTGAGGAMSKRLQRIGYVHGTDNAFGFIDPKDVIRGCHLIPGFYEGTTRDALPPSISSDNINGPGSDWKYYYVNQ
jgi:hypothetical protein